MNAKLITLEPKITNEGYGYNSIEFSLPHDIDMKKVFYMKEEIEKRFNYILESIIRESDIEDVYLATILSNGIYSTFQLSLSKEISPLEKFEKIRDIVKAQYGYDNFILFSLIRL